MNIPANAIKLNRRNKKIIFDFLKMFPLSIKDIKDWLIENRNAYQNWKAQEFPSFDNAVYSMYSQLYSFIEYYTYKQKCNQSLKDLKKILNTQFVELAKWTKKYEAMGSQELLMFEVNYINWEEDVNEELIKIHKDLYTERKPFVNIIYFCRVFQLLYWNNSIHEAELTAQEQLEIRNDLQDVLNKYYKDTTAV